MTPTTELDDPHTHYTYTLGGDQALRLADKLAPLGRGIQGDLYLPDRSTGELHLTETGDHITEIKLAASFEGEEIVKTTTKYRHATTLEVRMTVEDLPINEPRIQAGSTHPPTNWEPQTGPHDRR